MSMIFAAHWKALAQSPFVFAMRNNLLCSRHDFARLPVVLSKSYFKNILTVSTAPAISSVALAVISSKLRRPLIAMFSNRWGGFASQSFALRADNTFFMCFSAETMTECKRNKASYVVIIIQYTSSGKI